MTAAAPSRDALADAFRTQARGCAMNGSPIYADLLARAAEDVAAGGIFTDLLARYRGTPMLDALPLRLLGHAHALVLDGRAPALARFYPSAGGAYEADGAYRALVALCEEHRDAFQEAAVSLRVQTNEVRRSAALAPCFLHVAARTRLPLRLREIGSSAGLNLVFDRYGYALGPHRLGDTAAQLVLEADWDGGAPDADAPLAIADRRGCDVAPFDVRDPEHRLRLASFVWPEQIERLERLRAALAIAQADPPPIDAAPAGAWVAEHVSPQDGVATVLFHSVMWWYVPEAERARITELMDAAGARATAAAPLVWLRMEGTRLEETDLRVRFWPSGEDVLLGHAHWHGAAIRWLERPPAAR
jgi:hypothetical protein